MTQLNQIVAIEKGEKTKTGRRLTELYHRIQKTPLIQGISRTYTPKDEEGDQLPAEHTRVQVNVDDVLKEVGETMTRLFDVVLTKESANTEAFADVRIGENVILAHVPVTYLLFLEKQLVDLHTVVSKVPILDPSETWSYDPTAGAYRTEVTQTTRTKKVPRNHVLAPATDRHPAQVQMYHEDVIAGTWATIKFSGALQADRAKLLVDRVDALIRAVKFAREEANTMEITDRREAQAIFDYVLAP